MGRRETSILLIAMAIIPIALIAGCDLYENEGGDWENEAIIRVRNESGCLLNLYVDGVNEVSMNPADEYEKTDLNRGIHLLEAYPWNDEQFSCDRTYTDDMKNGQVFEWQITNEHGCGQCDPTPTSAPDTPTPSPEPESD